MKHKLLVMLFCTLMLLLIPGTAMAAEEINLGEVLPMWSVLPFVGLLLSIAIFPLLAPHWWEKRQARVSFCWALIFLIPFGCAFGAHEAAFNLLESVLLDYLPFIILLFGLFAVAGGITLRGSLVGSPKVNIIILAIGTLLSSWIGTTGSSMLMIRPIIHANHWRKKKAHVIVFFIFLVSNIGGCLTPVGDPPLLLGFLRNVPFFWTMRLLPLMLFNMAILLSVFFLLDRHFYKKEIAAGNMPPETESEKKEPLRVEGAHNLIFLVMIIFSVILNGLLTNFPFFADPVTRELHGFDIMGVVLPYNSLVEIAIILLAAFLSLKTTRQEIRQNNQFTWGPIKEVAVLFIGIFITMIPALAILKANGASLGITEPFHFFWITGALSSFLDNAPTYLVFLTTAGSLGATAGLSTTLGFIPETILMAISAGAVFMGANTYIGNAPNFMVRSIAEENGISMPSFFGYMAWSMSFLIPVFLLDTLIFFL